MKKMLITWIIIAGILVLGLTAIGIYLQYQNKEYYDLEEHLVESAKNYYAQFPEELPAAERIITDQRLDITGFLEDLKTTKGDCAGYVVVKKKNVFYEYNAFIKCPDYTTKKYDASNEEAVS